ncbi:MAG: HAMP domain-containing protein [Betaproteobacteria bacterium]|nr:HAMP domain-containing protein [Betaproteobacteria bacterium]
MTLLPSSLFWRLALLLLVLIVVSQAAAIVLFRQDRANLVMRQISDTKVAQIQALREALANTDTVERSGQLGRLEAAYGARLLRAEYRAEIGLPPRAPLMIELATKLREVFGEGTELRVQPREQMFWIRLQAGERAYWAGFPFSRLQENEFPRRFLFWTAFIVALLGVSAWMFARRIASPLRQLAQAVAAIGQGQTPAPLPDAGPQEVAQLSRGFNQMAANLQQMEADRVVLLASVSHDLRTPLARMRLGAEMGVTDPTLRQGMIEDVEEMDRIIHQFLDFARGEESLTMTSCDLNRIVLHVAERYRRDGREIHTETTELPQLILRSTSIERLLTNLIDNAYKYGSPSVDLATRRAAGRVVLEVADRGPGIPPDQVERLKQPFTRLSAARGGAMGSGLGLAIVERVARLHGGQFSLLPRQGGGTVARVSIPELPLPH